MADFYLPVSPAIIQTSIRIIDSYLKYDENIETAYLSHCKMLPQLEKPDKLYEIIHMFYEP